MATNDDMNSSFNSLLKGPYSEDNLYKFLDTLCQALCEDPNANVYTLDMFKDMFKKYDISSVENIRDYLLTESIF